MAEIKTKKLESLQKRGVTADAEPEDDMMDSEGEDTAENAFVAERKKRAARYTTEGAGLNQGDQTKEAADALDAASRKRRGSRLSPNEEELGMRDTAKKMRENR